MFAINGVFAEIFLGHCNGASTNFTKTEKYYGISLCDKCAYVTSHINMHGWKAHDEYPIWEPLSYDGKQFAY